MIEGLGCYHRISKSVIISDVFVVDLLAFSQLLEGLESPQIVVHAASLSGLSFVLGPILFFFQSFLDLSFDEKLLSCSCSHQLGALVIKLTLLTCELGLLKVKFRFLGLYQLALSQEFKSVNFNFVPDVIDVVLGAVKATVNHALHHCSLILDGLATGHIVGLPAIGVPGR